MILKDIKTCTEVLKRGPEVEAIIELKNNIYPKWSRDIETQIKPYMEIFKPQYFFLVSLKPLPLSIVRKLQEQNIIVYDEVYPGGRGEEVFGKIASILANES